jgi:hypothetical protein
VVQRILKFYDMASATTYNSADLIILKQNRWEYSNPGYLDALKHITDLKEEGNILNLYQIVDLIF